MNPYLAMQTFILNTFTSAKFTGNPTPVCFVEEMLNDRTMQELAWEFKYPVSAFISKQGMESYTIRYFTPLTEISTCGHATIAAAAVAGNSESPAIITFVNRDGSQVKTGIRDDMAWVLYPADTLRSYTPSGLLLDSLGIAHYVMAGINTSMDTIYIELPSITDVKNVAPDFERMIAASGHISEVVLTAAGDGDCDYVLRSFCPWIGIDEDPVTGSVQAVLAPYWAERTGKTSLIAHQLSSNGGELFLEIVSGQVRITGRYTHCEVIA